MKLLVVFNPNSGHGRSQKVLPQIQSLFNEKQIEIDLLPTRHHGHAVELVRDADLSQYNGVIAAGGDGTVFHVINGYMQNEGDNKPPMGVIPVGTGNAFARDIDLQTGEVKKAIDKITQNNPQKVDVAKYTAEGKTLYYLNILGFGFVSDVVQTANKFKIFGNIAYMIGVLVQIIFLKTHSLKIELDEQLVCRENIFVEVSNTTYTSNFYMAPSAKIYDGLLDVTLLNKCTRRQLIKSLPTIFTGEHVNLDFVETYKAKKIYCETGVPKIMTPDGELMESTPVTIECLHQAVEVFS